jgi:Cof subfamily protein (haloacid dehalogenase superfamily)
VTALPRLVATDLDGTLVDRDGNVTPYTREVLLEVERRGVPVVFVTGRPLRWARDVFEHVGQHGLAVISNGAAVWDVAADRARLERPITAEAGREFARLLREAVPGTSYAVERRDGIALEPEFMERYPVPDAAQRGHVDQLLADGAWKLLARHEELAPQEFWDRAEAATGDRLTITWSSSTTLLEISAAQVTKASTLALVCADLGIGPDEVVAFGDMPNDIPMLAWAGRSWAMADAHPSVLEVADEVAPGHHEDGVARVLAGLFDL